VCAPGRRGRDDDLRTRTIVWCCGLWPAGHGGWWLGQIQQRRNDTIGCGRVARWECSAAVQALIGLGTAARPFIHAARGIRAVGSVGGDGSD
jgi:hypothetical protein